MTATEGLGMPTAEQCAEMLVNLGKSAGTARAWTARGEKLDGTELADYLREDVTEARELADRLDEDAPVLAREYAERLRAAAQRGDDVLAGKAVQTKRKRSRVFRRHDEEVTALEFVRWRLDLPIAGVAKYGTDIDAEHDLHLESGESIRLGVARDVLDQTRARAAIFARTGDVFSRVKAAEWDEVAAALGELAYVVDTGATQDSETRAWIIKYLGSSGHAGTVDTNDRDALLAVLNDEWAARAFLSTEGRVYVHLPSLLEKLTRVDRVRITNNELAARLTRLGFDKRRLQVRSYDGPQIRRQLWESPANYELDTDDCTTHTT